MTNQNDEFKGLLAHLVMSLATSAMQHMGKLVNPATNKTEVNLEAAQATIDMLDMLEAKMKGNLDAEETQFLSSTISTLKLNYVETAQSAPPPRTEPASTDEPKAPTGDTPQGEDGRRKFHKKYE